MLNYPDGDAADRARRLDCNDSPQGSGTNVTYGNSFQELAIVCYIAVLTCDLLFLLKFLAANDANRRAAQIREETV